MHGGRTDHISALDLSRTGVDDEFLARWLEQRRPGALRWLALNYDPVSARGIRTIAASLRGLQYLELAGVTASPFADPDAPATEFSRELENDFGRLAWLHRDAWVNGAYPPHPFEMRP